MPCSRSPGMGREGQPSPIRSSKLQGSAASLLPRARHQVGAMSEVQGRPRRSWRTPILISRLAPASQCTTVR